MLEITNSKLLPTGRFRSFPGFSLLFDPPGEQHFSPLAGGVNRLDCRVDADPCLRLYAGLQSCVENIVQPALLPGCAFSDLPPYSYHVTVWDGLNEDNRERVYARYRSDLAAFLTGLPGTFQPGSRFTALPESSPLAGDWPITFQFDRLVVFGNRVLVALLKPVDDEARQTCERIAEQRIALYRAFERELGLDAWRALYTPHVSLGYFGNESSGEAAAARVDRWNDAFVQAVGGETVHFERISLYGFLDMETFFKR